MSGETPTGSRAQEQTCALRALTICDGQELEEPDGALTRCICDQLRWIDDLVDEVDLARYRRHRQDLIERCLVD